MMKWTQGSNPALQLIPVVWPWLTNDGTIADLAFFSVNANVSMRSCQIVPLLEWPIHLQHVFNGTA
jgi:hypothetical protein